MSPTLGGFMHICSSRLSSIFLMKRMYQPENDSYEKQLVKSKCACWAIVPTFGWFYAYLQLKIKFHLFNEEGVPVLTPLTSFACFKSCNHRGSGKIVKFHLFITNETYRINQLPSLDISWFNKWLSAIIWGRLSLGCQFQYWRRKERKHPEDGPLHFSKHCRWRRGTDMFGS